MMFDLTVRPDDWLLGLWWTEFEAGEHYPFPGGGHRLALVRLIAPGNTMEGATWIIEECSRRVGGTWTRQQRFETLPGCVVAATMECRQKLLNSAPGCSGSSLQINGSAATAARLLSFPGVVPDWMSVLVIEHWNSSVPEAS